MNHSGIPFCSAARSWRHSAPPRLFTSTPPLEGAEDEARHTRGLLDGHAESEDVAHRLRDDVKPAAAG